MYKVQYKSHNATQAWFNLGSYGSEASTLSNAALVSRAIHDSSCGFTRLGDLEPLASSDFKHDPEEKIGDVHSMQVSIYSGSIPLPVFIAGWIVWTERFARDYALDGTLPWDRQEMPVGAAHSGLAQRLIEKKGYVWSVDMLCRFLSRCSDQMQSGHTAFAANNSNWLKPIAALESAVTGRKVNGYALTDASIDAWRALSRDKQETSLADFNALLEARGEVLEDDNLVYATLPDEGTNNSQISAPVHLVKVGGTHVNSSTPSSRSRLIKELVELIQTDPFQPMYRGQPVPGAAAVSGWDQRLSAYFWPTPKYRAAYTQRLLKGINGGAFHLLQKAKMGLQWTPSEEGDAVAWANRVFAWGGVPQPNVTASVVRAVVDAAIAANVAPGLGVPMNSGWTKLAAFASQLASCPLELVIWDSRVATALTARLDRHMVAAGIVQPSHLFPDIGWVPGRGGTRPRALQLKWKSGYRSWATQIAGSELVAEIVAVLNGVNPAGKYPGPSGRYDFPRPPSIPEETDEFRTAANAKPQGNTPFVGRGPQSRDWTTREVEMVLFMDGY